MSTRGCARRKRISALVLAAAALTDWGGRAAAAEEPLQLQTAMLLAPAQYEGVIVTVSVNQQKRGELTLYRDAGGDYYARPADLRTLGLADSGVAGRRVEIDGEAFVSLRSLGALGFVFDEPRLTLEVTFPTPRLERHVYDLAPRRAEKAFEPREQAAFVNYRLSASDERGGEPARLGLANELAVRSGNFLLRNEAALVYEAGATHSLRYATQLVYDRREDQQRAILGDQTAASGELGSTLAIGGAGFSKLYQMTPYFIRQPLAGYAGTVSTPSQVEVRLGGVPVFREQVAPGPWEVKNLQSLVGTRDVEVVVRDALGREQVVGFPYYFADQSLRAGLHEYSYSIGALHENIGVANADYGAGVFSAFHRYGLSDHVTLGLRGEGASSLWNFGPTALYRNDRLGALSASYAWSGREGRGGSAASLGHVYQAGYFGWHANARRYSDTYATVQDLIAPTNLRAEYGAGVSFSGPSWGSVYLDYSVTQRRESTGLPDTTVASLGYTRSFSPGSSLFVTLTRTQELRDNTQLFVGVLIALDRKTTLHLNTRSQSERPESYGAQIAQAVPPGEGLGYRLGYDGTASGDAANLNAYLQYNTRAASYVFDSGLARTADTRSGRAEIAMAGAAAYAGGRWGATRQIEDSFVAVQLAAPLEGVRVYSNNQEIGRTDREGRLLVPRVGSFYETQITIEEKDVPLDYTISELRRVVAPPYRSGSLLAFDVRRLHAVEGVIRVRRGDATALAANAGFTLERDGRAEEYDTGRDGRYYIEDLSTGSYEAVLHVDGRDCRFTLRVPASDAALTLLPEVTACD
jgi:outer membrane usher protein FimD/PapC